MLVLFTGIAAAGEVQAQNAPCLEPADVTVKPTSRTPADHTGYEVVFTIPEADRDNPPGGCQLAPVTDGVRMVLHEDIGVARTIDPAKVRVKASALVGDQPGRGTGTAVVELEDQDDPRHPTILTLFPAVAPDDDSPPRPIAPGAEVTVTFQPGAGIFNPTEGGAFSWTVATVHRGEATNATPARHPAAGPEDKAVLDAFKDVELAAEHPVGDDGYAEGLLVDWEIQLTHEMVGRGTEVTAIGRGFKNGTSLTFWRDADFNGVRDNGEEQLCQANVDGNDIGSCTFTVQRPPFVRAFGKCDMREGSREAAGGADCNFVNAVDGQNHSSIWVRDADVREHNSVEHVSQVLDLTGEIVAEPGAGRRLNVHLVDFPDGEVVEMDIGGVPIDLESLRDRVVPSSGSLYFTVDLPGKTRRGYQSLRVVVEHIDEGSHSDLHEVETIVWVEPDAIVTSTPDTVLPNQRISLKGNGFIVEDGSGEIAAINIGGHLFDLSGVNGGEGPAPIDRSGSWRGFVDLPINSATTTPGARQLRIVDSQGRGGSVELTIPPREIEAAPVLGRPGAIVTVKGTGFPALNRNQSGVNVRIYYDFEGGSAITSAEPDATGNFSVELRLPLNTSAPSSNTIRAEFEDDNGAIIVTTTAHEVPGATVAVDPQSGPPGTPISLTGQGFRQFTKVHSVMIGDLDVTPGGAPATDANGEFSLTFLVPGAGVGSQIVLVTIAGVTASVPFDISPSGVSSGTTVPVAKALQELGDTLVRTFHFNNDAKVWTFYDPELTADEYTQRFTITGETYMILVRETVSAVLNGKLRNLTCYQGNCWNQIIW